MVLPPLVRELDRRAHAEGGVWSVGVVLLAPVGDKDLGLEQRVEALDGDLVVGANNRPALVTAFDRMSRKLWVAELSDGYGADETLAAVGEIIDRIPEELRHTLAWDQGREMARHRELAEIFGIDAYFCDPHSPWQRPTNENGNGLLRRYVGKGTDLSIYGPDELRAIEHRINTMPLTFPPQTGHVAMRPEVPVDGSSAPTRPAGRSRWSSAA